MVFFKIGGVFLFEKYDLSTWVEAAIIASLAYVLGFIPIQSGNAAFDLSLGLIPLVLFSFKRGAIPAIVAGFLWGLLSILTGKAIVVSVPQVIFEYPFAFSFAGLGGVFSAEIKKDLAQHHQKRAIFYMVLASFVATFSRWFWHFWAGVFVWGSYAPIGQSPYLFSFLANGASFVTNFILLSVAFTLLLKLGKKRFIYFMK